MVAEFRFTYRMQPPPKPVQLSTLNCRFFWNFISCYCYLFCSAVLVVSETVLVVSETVLVVSETVLVLSETVLVLVIESSLKWCYVRSTHELLRNATKLFPVSELEQDQEHGLGHRYRHRHGTGPESQTYWPLFFLSSPTINYSLSTINYDLLSIRMSSELTTDAKLRQSNDLIPTSTPES